MHMNALTQETLVLGVFLDIPASPMQMPNNSFLNTLQGRPVTVTDGANTLNPYYSMLPGVASHWEYTGSLTTPPCSPGVQWVVFDTPVRISLDDLSILRAAGAALPTNFLSESGNNNRYPAIPLNGRTVSYVPSARGVTEILTYNYSASMFNSFEARTTYTTATIDASDARVETGSITVACIALLAVAVLVGVVLRLMAQVKTIEGRLHTITVTSATASVTAGSGSQFQLGLGNPIAAREIEMRSKICDSNA